MIRTQARTAAQARRGGWLPSLAALALGILAGLPTAAGAADFGTIKGRLVWGGDKAPEPQVKFQKGDPMAKDSAVCAVMPIVSEELVVDQQNKGVQNAFVYLVVPKGKAGNPEAEKELLAKSATVDVDQKTCQFVPHCAGVYSAQKLVFKSSDPVNHNVRMSPFTNAAFNKILPPKGMDEVKLVAERRPIPLTCDIHPWMKGYVMVFDHPFFAVTKSDGSFEIKGVPAGDHKVVVWQEKAGYVNQGAGQGMPIKVQSGKETDLGEIKLDPKKVK